MQVHGGGVGIFNPDYTTVYKHGRWMAFPEPGSARVFFLVKRSFFSYCRQGLAHMHHWIAGAFSNIVGSLPNNIKHFEVTVVVNLC